MTKMNSPSEISFTVFKTIIVCTITLGIALYAGWFCQTKSESNKPGIKRTSNQTNLFPNKPGVGGAARHLYTRAGYVLYCQFLQTNLKFVQTNVGLGPPLLSPA